MLAGVQVWSNHHDRQALHNQDNRQLVVTVFEFKEVTYREFKTLADALKKTLAFLSDAGKQAPGRTERVGMLPPSTDTVRLSLHTLVVHTHAACPPYQLKTQIRKPIQS